MRFDFRLFLRAAIAVTLLSFSYATSAAIIAFDMVNSASQNLNSYTNPWTDSFSSVGDGFQIYQRGVSPTIPFSVVDDSLIAFPPDTQGIIDENNTDTFFGMTDTVNGDTSGPVSATWEFDVSGFSGLSFSIDIGAMGDFETSDNFAWGYSIDGGAATTLLEAIVDETTSHTYTMASGTPVLLQDPLTVNGTVLSNQLQTFSAAIIGSGSVLSLTLTGSTNGGSEAMAFQNLIIEGTAAVPEPTTLLLMGLGLAGLGFARRRRLNA